VNALDASIGTATNTRWVDDDWWNDAVVRYSIVEPFPSDERRRQRQRLDQAAAELHEFQQEQLSHERHERQIMWKELATVGVVVSAAIVRQLWLS
jgi:hypothetical protein